MKITTDLSGTPFYDDYDASKGYVKTLYRPGAAIQARELNQTQTMNQEQIERFADNIFKEGTIIKGCNFNFDNNYNYIKIKDNNVFNQPVNVSQFSTGSYLVNSANLTAIILETVSGLESQNPDLNTIYIKYINSANNATRDNLFKSDQIINVYANNYSLQKITVSNGGTGYSNTDTIIFTSSNGSGASATLTTSSTGVILGATITDGGSGYTTLPTLTIANSSLGTSNGSGAILSIDNKISQVIVAGNTFSIAGNTTFDTVGSGYSMKIGDGTIYQKGYFVDVASQSTIVSKYSNKPDNISVGFDTIETVVNNSIDITLNDNASGTTNYNASGAFRLKLEPTLVTKITSETDSNTFFSLVDFSNGNPVRQRQVTEYNTLGTEMSKRADEQLGDFVIKPFVITTEAISSNVTHVNAKVSSGLAYVNGYRVEQYNSFNVPIRKGNDIKEQQNVSTNISIGNYVLVKNYTGTIVTQSLPTINLYDTVKSGYVNSNVGNIIGTATASFIEYDSGIIGTSDSVYRVYLSNIQMNNGKSFDMVRAVEYNNGTGISGSADLVMEGGRPVLKDSSFKTLIFNIGHDGVKTLRDLNNNNDSYYEYIVCDTSLSISSGGILQKTTTGNDIIPYTGTLTTIEENELILIPRTSANTASKTGTISISSGNNVIVGTGTQFITDLTSGDFIILSNGNLAQISSVANNTYASIKTNAVTSASGLTYKLNFPANIPISLNRGSRTVVGSTNQLTINLGTTLSNSVDASLYHKVKRNPSVQLIKNIQSDVKVKINCANAGISGSYSLGIPDVLEIQSITITDNVDYVSNTQNVTSHFILDTNQKDTCYGLSKIVKKPTSNLNLTANTRMLVTFKTFLSSTTGGGIGYYSIDSYPIDDVNSSNNTIKTENIPTFTSPTTGAAYNLRNSIDFRPYVANTVVVTTDVSLAPINPSSVEVFDSSNKYLPKPNSNFVCDIQYYMGRYDKITLSSLGLYNVVSGIPSNNPYPPNDINGAMTIGILNIPPYPSLSTDSVSNSANYTIKTESKQTKRYTMKDIGNIEQRLQKIEYYTALSLLETQTQNMSIPSSLDPTLDRFKNGIFVDTFSDFKGSNLLDVEYNAAINDSEGFCLPKFKTTKIDLKVANTNNVSVSNHISTLNYTNKQFISQPFASKVRNCTENFWSFKGIMKVFPEYDNFVETRTSPTNVTITNDSTASVLALIDNINTNYVNKNDTASTVTSSNTNLVSTATTTTGISMDMNAWARGRLVLNSGGTTTTETYETVTSTTTSSTKNILVGSTTETNKNVGDFITDISFLPYIREQVIYVSAFGLKPNTKVYCFFDGKNLSNSAKQCNYNSLGTTNETIFLETLSNELVTSSNGSIYFKLHIPANTFFVGDREIKILDVDNLSSESSSSTSSSFMFSAYNYSVTSTNVVVSTRNVQVDTQVIAETATSTSRNTFERSTFVSNARVDPIAQTFFVQPSSCDGQEGVFVSKLQLFFKRKDNNFGLTVQLRTTDNGYPASSIIPFSSKRLSSSDVNVSDNASVPTEIVFDSPVFLKAGFEYSLVVLPEANSPEYLIYVSKVGDNDLTNTNAIIRSDWGDGVLFTSTNNSAWNSIQNEDLKFNLFVCDFTATTGTTTYVNEDYEFIGITSVTNNLNHGDLVFKYNHNKLTGNVNVTNNSTLISGLSTSFINDLSVGEYVVISDSYNPLTTSQFHISPVISIANNTSLNIGIPSKFSGNNVAIFKPFVGKVYEYNINENNLILDNSNATNSKLLSNNSILISPSSNSVIQTNNIYDLPVDYLQPIVYRTSVTNTSTNAQLSMLDNNKNTQAFFDLKYNNTSYLNNYQAVIPSKSNQIVSGGRKGIVMNINMTSESEYISPTIDNDSISLITYNNIINNNITNEKNTNGQAIAKYVSRIINLSQSQDSEDMIVYLTAHKPFNTDINVYVKVLNKYDSDSIKNKKWTKLELIGNDIKVDAANRDVAYEYSYTFPTSPEIISLSGQVSTTLNSNTIIGLNTSFLTELSNMDNIRIISADTNQEFITSVNSITDNTHLITNDILPFSISGAKIYKFETNGEAFRDNNNDKIISYFYNTNKLVGYHAFALKVVMTSTSSNIVPNLKDIRAIAMSI